jgi:hypothetical protein
MKTSSNLLNNHPIPACAALIATFILLAAPAFSGTILPDCFPENRLEFRNPFLPPPNPGNPAEIKWPELYIEPTVKFGLNLVLPSTIRTGLAVDAGYDRLQGLPTLKAEYFMPIKGWTDKTLFLAPRFSLDAKTEAVSVGAGFRHLLTSETMIGFHAFHDWMKRRGIQEEFLKEAGVGFELSALPGRYSDLSLNVNAYFPVNERIMFKEDGAACVREKLPTGVDAKLAFLLPAVVDWLDIRMEGTLHSYRGERVDLTGHKASISANTRDGMLRASVSHETDTFKGDNYQVEGSINVAFDWNELIKGEVPFAAPYKVSSMRFERNIRDGLYDRVTRRHDLPLDQAEKRLALSTHVNERTVFFDGGFPDLPNSHVTIQVSQSPWRDAGSVVTDSSGSYKGKLELPAGEYKFRLVHKPTGRMSAVKTLVIDADGTSR